MLLVSIIGTAISFFTMAFAPNYIFLFIARMLDGLTAGNIPVAFAVISDSTKPEERAKAFGMVGAALNFGFIFGPAISALTVGFGSGVPFIVAGIITVIAIILTALFLPETNKHMGEVKKEKLFDFVQLWHTLFEPNIGSTFLISLVYFLAFSCAIIYGFQPFTSEVLKISAQENAELFTVFGIIGLIAQTFLVQLFNKLWGMKNAFRNAIFFVAISFLMIFFSKSLPLFLAAMVVMGIFNSIIQTLITAILSAEADEKSQGSMMGLNASYQSIGMIAGPILGGVVATISIPSVFMAGALLVLICFWISFQIMRPGVSKESAF